MDLLLFSLTPTSIHLNIPDSTMSGNTNPPNYSKATCHRRWALFERIEQRCINTGYPLSVEQSALVFAEFNKIMAEVLNFPNLDGNETQTRAAEDPEVLQAASILMSMRQDNRGSSSGASTDPVDATGSADSRQLPAAEVQARLEGAQNLLHFHNSPMVFAQYRQPRQCTPNWRRNPSFSNYHIEESYVCSPPRPLYPAQATQEQEQEQEQELRHFPTHPATIGVSDDGWSDSLWEEPPVKCEGLGRNDRNFCQATGMVYVSEGNMITLIGAREDTVSVSESEEHTTSSEGESSNSSEGGIPLDSRGDDDPDSDGHDGDGDSDSSLSSLGDQTPILDGDSDGAANGGGWDRNSAPVPVGQPDIHMYDVDADFYYSDGPTPPGTDIEDGDFIP